MQGVIAQLKQLNRERTSETYTAALRSFMTFRENQDLPLSGITSDLLLLYEAYLKNRGICMNTISFYMRILRAVYNRAVERGLIAQQHPFRHVYTGVDKTIKRAIPIKSIKALKALDLTKQLSLDFARDMFLFSFYTREKFREVFREVSSLYKDMDKEERKALADYNKLFRQMETSAFFCKVGEFEGFRQESAILQQRSGYSQIYKTWLMLKSSLELVDGKTDIGMKKIWELYEIWCFLVMKRLIAKVLGLCLNDTEHIHENKSEMLNTMLKSEMSHSVEFINPNNGDVVRLEYQHTYNRNSKEFKTTTTEQRPDIVVTITKPDSFVLTYLYDAKYRVQDDKNDGELDEGADIDLADYPLPDVINQMHRYRDAIYYAMKEDERPRGKEIIGGYILFPGRTGGDAVENRYFYKSIKQVNIGAFPLLPADEEHKDDIVQSNLLEKHLQEILLDNTAFEQIKNSIPQKGLKYRECGKGNGVALIMMENYDDKHNKFSNGKIAVPVKLTESGMTLLEYQAEIAYVLFHTRKKEENKHLFRVESIVRVLAKEDATHEGYYLVQSTAKRYLCIEINLEKELDSNRFNPSKDNIPYDTNTERYDSQFATISQLVQNS